MASLRLWLACLFAWGGWVFGGEVACTGYEVRSGVSRWRGETASCGSVHASVHTPVVGFRLRIPFLYSNWGEGEGDVCWGWRSSGLRRACAHCTRWCTGASWGPSVLLTATEGAPTLTLTPSFLPSSPSCLSSPSSPSLLLGWGHRPISVFCTVCGCLFRGYPPSQHSHATRQ